MGRLGLSRPKQDGAQKGPTFCARGDRVLRGAVPMTKLLGTTAGAAWEATGGHAPEPTPRALCPRPREPSYGPSEHLAHLHSPKNTTSAKTGRG